jgi:membrane protein YqaA with SNARE-associated domain
LAAAFPDKRVGAMLLALVLVWGFGEATVFFVVPDVIISYCALAYGWRAGVLALLVALIGATFGGIVTYYWGQADIGGARAFFDHLPAIAPATIARAGEEIATGNYAFAMLKGAISSVPFKLYASEAGAARENLATFVALTPLVRFPRFAFAALGALVARQFTPSVLQGDKLKWLAGFWLVFYALYWMIAPK